VGSSAAASSTSSIAAVSSAIFLCARQLGRAHTVFAPHNAELKITAAAITDGGA
jgi:hypothetical protein